MATHSAVLSAVAAKVESEIGASRLDSDLRDDTGSLAAGALAYQLRGVPSGRAFRSNPTLRVLSVQLELIRALGDSEQERDWTEGALLDHLDLLTDGLWWGEVTGVLEVGEQGEGESGFNVTIEREGRIVSATVEATLVLKE